MPQWSKHLKKWFPKIDLNTTKDEGKDMQLPVKGEAYRLNLLGMPKPIYDLSYDELLAVSADIVEKGTIDGTCLIETTDFLLYWSWCAQLLRTKPSFWQPCGDLEDLMDLVMASVLAEPEKVACIHARRVANAKWRVMAYLAFPLLEGILKMVCKEFVSKDGEVLKPFFSYKKGGQCSSVSDMLQLYVNDIANEKPKNAITSILFNIKEKDAKKRFGCQVLYSWRNDMLHGSDYHTVGATVLTLACIIAISTIPDIERHRGNALLDSVSMSEFPQSDQVFVNYHFPHRKELFTLLPSPIAVIKRLSGA